MTKVDLNKSATYGLFWCAWCMPMRDRIVAREGRGGYLEDVAAKVLSGDYYYNVGDIDSTCPGCTSVGHYLAESAAYTIEKLIAQDRKARGILWPKKY